MKKRRIKRAQRRRRKIKERLKISTPVTEKEQPTEEVSLFEPEPPPVTENEGSPARRQYSDNWYRGSDWWMYMPVMGIKEKRTSDRPGENRQ